MSHRLALPLTLALAAACAADAARAEPAVVAPPGAIVLWQGDGIERCELDATGPVRTFAPAPAANTADGPLVCAIPVDLLASGTLTATRLRKGRTERLEIEVGEYPYRVQRLRIDDPRRNDPSEEDLARIRRESRRIAALWSLDGPAADRLPLSAPLEHLPPGGRFGSRRFINDEPRNPHTGADYAADRGTPVLAAGAGTVALAEEHFFAGNSIFIDHGDGLVTMYFHLDEIFVAAGDSVTRGAVIGTVGSTGRATGPHLHFGVRWRGARIDPAYVLGQKSALALP